MAERLNRIAFLRRLAGEPISFEWLVVDTDAAEVLASGVCEATVSPTELEPLKVHLLLDATTCRNQVLDIPARNARLARKVAGFALEDQLAVDLEDLRFAVGNAVEPNRYPVSYIASAALEAQLAAASSVCAGVDGAANELYGLPLTPGGISMLALADDASGTAEILIRTGTHEGFRAQRAIVETWLERAGIADDTPVTMFGFSADDALMQGLSARLPNVRTEPLPAGMTSFGFLALNYRSSDAAGFVEATDTGKAQPWLWMARVASLVLMAMISHAGYQYWQTSRLEQQTDALRLDAEARYRELFPDAVRLDNLYAQLQGRLNQLVQQPGVTLSFTSTLFDVGAAMQGGAPLRLQSLAFNANQLDFAVNGDAMTTVEAFQSRLNANGREVKLVSVESANESVLARMRISGAP